MSTADETEAIRRAEQAEINGTAAVIAAAHPEDPKAALRKSLEASYGQVWDTNELSRDFEVQGFMAPYVVVRRKSDGAIGSLQFSHDPRLFFNFEPDGR